MLLLRRMRVAPLARVPELIEDLTDRASEPAVHSKSMRRIDRFRGLTYGIIGLALVLVPQLVTPAITGEAADVVRWVSFIGSLIPLAGFLLIIRARRYFQIDADALLAVDKRSPMSSDRSQMISGRSTGIRSGAARLLLGDAPRQSLPSVRALHRHRFPERNRAAARRRSCAVVRRPVAGACARVDDGSQCHHHVLRDPHTG